MCLNELYGPPSPSKKRLYHCLSHHMAAFPATRWHTGTRDSRFGRSGTLKIRSTPAMFVYSVWPSPGARFARGIAGFLGEESYFWPPRVGSDVTSVSSSSGLGSSLAPEILLSFPVVLREVEEVWSHPTRRRWAGRVVSVASLPLIQWCFSGWQMLLNPPWPRELWWLSWVTGP